jgi:2-methylcitrate dehydratase PrpD
VQDLLRHVTVTPIPELSARFAQAMPARLEVELANGTRLHPAREAYRGFHTDPLDWADVRAKFDVVPSLLVTPSLNVCSRGRDMISPYRARKLSFFHIRCDAEQIL